MAKTEQAQASEQRNPESLTESSKDIAKDDKRHRRWPHPVMLFVAVVVFLLAVGVLATAWHRHYAFSDDRGFMQHRFVSAGSEMPMHMNRQRDYNPTSGVAETELNGVVTQVNGDTFTIAGHGTTKTIKTTSSTVFNNAGNKVTVNDSVSVRGSDQNGTFTATAVDILN